MKTPIVFLFFLIVSSPTEGMQNPISETEAVNCICGESRLEFTKYGYDAFLSIAEALRNRGTTDGVYGCKPLWGLTPAQYRIDKAWLDRYDGINQAKRAWQESQYSTLVKGATHWEGSQYKTPSWAKKMDFIVEIADHKFYKPKQKRR